MQCSRGLVLRLLILLAYYPFASIANAQSKKGVTTDECILGFVSVYSSDDLFISSRGVTSACACITNKLAQRLDPRDCPRIGAVPTQKLKEAGFSISN